MSSSSVQNQAVQNEIASLYLSNSRLKAGKASNIKPLYFEAIYNIKAAFLGKLSAAKESHFNGNAPKIDWKIRFKLLATGLAFLFIPPFLSVIPLLLVKKHTQVKIEEALDSKKLVKDAITPPKKQEEVKVEKPLSEQQKAIDTFIDRADRINPAELIEEDDLDSDWIEIEPTPVSPPKPENAENSPTTDQTAPSEQDSESDNVEENPESSLETADQEKVHDSQKEAADSVGADEDKSSDTPVEASKVSEVGLEIERGEAQVSNEMNVTAFIMNLIDKKLTEEELNDEQKKFIQELFDLTAAQNKMKKPAGGKLEFVSEGNVNLEEAPTFKEILDSNLFSTENLSYLIDLIQKNLKEQTEPSEKSPLQIVLNDKRVWITGGLSLAALLGGMALKSISGGGPALPATSSIPYSIGI